MILRRKWKVFNEEFPKLESRWVKYGARFFVANSNYYFRQRNASRRKFDKKLIPFLRCSMHACILHRLHANPSSEFPKVCHKIGMTLQLLSGFLSVIQLENLLFSKYVRLHAKERYRGVTPFGPPWQAEADTELTLSASPTTAVGQKALALAKRRYSTVLPSRFPILH